MKSVVVHPLVGLSILEHYLRRKGDQERVIGALLGRRTADGVVITNTFPVPHADAGEGVAVGKESLRQLLSLYQRVKGTEELVGWYATSLTLNDQNVMIHDFITTEAKDPLHLVMDTKTQEMKAYTTGILALGERVLGISFQQVKIVEDVTDYEVQTLHAMVQANNLEAKVEKNSDRLDVLLEKVKEKMDDETVREKLHVLLEKIPHIPPEIFAKSFNTSLHDLLMLSYLSNLTKAQLAVADKLN